jgi:membrane-bound ClpP family serine protease
MMNPIEICGAVATILVFVSFLPTNIKWIRWLNLVGSVFFIIYGFNVGAIWNGITNVGLLFVQIFHLSRIYYKERMMRDV